LFIISPVYSVQLCALFVVLALLICCFV